MELTAFGRDMLRRPSAWYIGWILLMMAAFIGLSWLPGAEPEDCVPPSVALYFLVVAVHVIRRVVQGGGANILAPDLLFLAVYTAFHQGYLLFWVLGVVPYSDQIFYYVPTLPLSLLIVNLGMLGAILGFEICPRRSAAIIPEQGVLIPALGWGAAALFVMVLGIVMHVTTIFVVGIGLFLDEGYVAVARLNEFVGRPWSLIWSRSEQVFLLGLTTYVVYSSLRYRKLFASKTALILVSGMIGLFVLEGDRGPIFLICLALLLVRQYLIRPIKLVVLAAIVAILLSLFAAMEISRSRALSPGAMVSEWKYARSKGELHWWSPIVEAGASVRIADMTTMIVPDQESFWYGDSWLSAAAKIVPFLEGALARAGLLREAPSQWITYEIYGTGAAGLGFSLPVEGYLNFGLPGVVLEMLFFGALLRGVCVYAVLRPSAFSALIMFGVLAPTIKVIRDHASLVTFVYAQTLVWAWLLNVIFGNEPRVRVLPGGAGENAGFLSLPNTSGVYPSS